MAMCVEDFTRTTIKLQCKGTEFIDLLLYFLINIYNFNYKTPIYYICLFTNGNAH